MEIQILYHKVMFLRRVIILILILAPVMGFAQEESPATELNLDELRRRIFNEAPEEIFNTSIGDSSVSFFLTGSWKGDLHSNFGFSVSPLGTGFVSPETPLLFKQEVDLLMSLWINNRWFVEVNFLDDSNLNTYRAGYQGLQGEFLQYAGIGNTGLDFPSFPYLDLGGDSPSSFGFYSRFGSPQLNIHALLRYDAASREERIFSGSRERTYSDLHPQNSIRGVSFVLPDIDIDPEVIIYIEDEKGSILDTSGRRWRFALHSEFAVSRHNGLLELSTRPQGMVAVFYTKSGERPWNISMGSYDGMSYGYLSEVQNWFDSSPGRDKIKLEEFPQCGGSQSERPGEVIFGTNHALVIYQPGTFSPFERRNRYDAASNTTERAALVSISSGTEINNFSLVLLESTAIEDIFTFSATVSQRGVYELVRSGNINRRDPGVIWPLAAQHDTVAGMPEVYLPSRGNVSGDVIIRFTNYSSSSGYYIGTDVIPGSIQVWRSGIQDTNFIYSSSSGEVIISGSVGINELIRITYLKISEGTHLGSIAAGLGVIYKNGSNPFSAQAAIGVRWNLTEDSFTEYDLSSEGSVGLSAKAALDYDYLNAHVTGGFAFVQTDTTGLYRAAGMEGNETILTLPAETSFISNPPSSVIADDYDFNVINRSDLIYRNYYDNNILGNTLMSLDWNAPVVTQINRPYPVKDSKLGDTTVLAAEFNIKSGGWTGYQVPLFNSSQILSNVREIEIPYRFHNYNNDNPENFRIIIQIGSLSGKDFAFIENKDLIWEKTLFKDDWNLIPPVDPNGYYSNIDFNYNPRIARFILNDEDRLKMGDAKNLRIIIIYEGDGELTGRVLLAPPIIKGASFRAVTFNGNNISEIQNILSGENRVTAVETIDPLLASAYSEIITRLHPVQNTQRVLKVDWENMGQGISAGFDGRIGELPLSDYRELSFFVKGPQPDITGTLSFTIASGPDSLQDFILNTEIPLAVFTPGKWSKVTIRYQGGGTGITVDGINIPNADLRYRQLSVLNDSYERRTSYIAVLVNPENGDLPQALEDGSISIDEIILEDSILFYRMNAGAGVSFSRPGTFVSIGNSALLADFSVYSLVESEARANSDVQDQQFSGSMINRSGAEVSFLGVKVSGNFAFTAAEDTFIWRADHSISRSFGPLTIKEVFYASPMENTVNHGFNAVFLSDFYTEFKADTLYNFSRLRQRWNLNFGYRSENQLIPAAAVNTEAVWTRNENIKEDAGYGELWIDTWALLVPDNGSGADSRRTNAQIILTQRTRPVGAVVTLEGNTNFSGVNNITRSESTAFLDVPVMINNVNFVLRSGRGFKKHIFYSGENVFDDGTRFFESIDDSFPVWGVFPIYSLFAPELNVAFEKGLNNPASKDLTFYTSLNDHFSTRINIPQFYNLLSFAVPSRITFGLERTLEQKMDTNTDRLNIGGSLSFSSINMFGAMGYKPLFNFYQTDEYSHAIDAAFIFPRDEEISWRIQSVLGAGFRGFSGSVLNFVNTLTMRTGRQPSADQIYWIESFSAAWEAPTKNSMLSLIYDRIAASAEKQSSWLNLSSVFGLNYEQLRRESLEFVIDKSTDNHRWNISAGHEEVVRILGRVNFTTFIKLRCSEDIEKETFMFDILLGTTLRLSF